MVTPDESQEKSAFNALHLKRLTLENMRHIDEILASLGEYGEVHLVVQRGELRYINKVQSFKAWKNERNK